MTKTDEFAIDPCRFQGERENPFIPGSYQGEREQLTAHVIRDLIAHPQTTRNPRTGAILPNADPVWHRIRDLPVRPDGLTVDRVLSRIQVGGPIPELTRLIRFLLGARERRLELLKEIEQLELIERAFGTPVAETIRERGASDHRVMDRLAGGAR